MLLLWPSTIETRSIGYSGLEQLDSERVAEAVRVAVWNLRKLEHGF